MNKVRGQRNALRELRAAGRIDKATFRNIYRKSKAGFFRSRSHMISYMEREGILKAEKK